MEKKVIIAGAGMGDRAVMTTELLLELERAELIIGPGRIVRPFQKEGRNVLIEYRAEKILTIVEGAGESRILILVSGDQGFFSAAESIRRLLTPFHPRILPGISSVAYFSAKIGIPYSNACIKSAHGRSLNIASVVRRSRVSFILAGGNLQELLNTLCRYGFPDVEVYIGENLSYGEETIRHGTASELELVEGESRSEFPDQFSSLSLMAVINPEAEEAVPFGIPDGEFVRGAVPMTKREVRSLVLSSLMLSADSIVVDIGAGTGSVSVEAALSAYNGAVYAVERKPEALALIAENTVRFHTDNVRIVEGEAPEALDGLPPADAYFIGGSGGRLERILQKIKMVRGSHSKSDDGEIRRREGKSLAAEKNPVSLSGKKDRRCRIVISALTLQTLSKAQENLYEIGADHILFTQLQASRSQRVGNYDLFKAENPVWIISADL